MNRAILLTVDVEDWFQVENFKSHIPFQDWPRCELRVERNTRRLLDLLEEIRPPGRPALRATFFILGWLARRLPDLVRDIRERGHEVASHGINHELCSGLPHTRLRQDLEDSRKLLEDLTGAPIHGYRAPSFSISDPVLTMIRAAGYTYDSSYNSFALHGRYGHANLNGHHRGIAVRIARNFHELPISNLQVGRVVLPLGGGGYFRIIPGPLFEHGVRAILKHQDAYLFYLHPWEIDPDQPRVTSAPASFRFRHYVNLGRTRDKLRHLIAAFHDARFLTCQEYLAGKENSA